jgi:hypothetical protein
MAMFEEYERILGIPEIRVNYIKIFVLCFAFYSTTIFYLERWPNSFMGSGSPGVEMMIKYSHNFVSPIILSIISTITYPFAVKGMYLLGWQNLLFIYKIIIIIWFIYFGITVLIYL